VVGTTITVDHETCMHCGACVGTCPVNALTLDETVVRVNDECIHCGLCVTACPVGALEDLEG
jgi:NAD-dependent dihydropyrimidine dehydrogenase PreA subunit